MTDIKPNDYVVAREDFFTEFSYGKVQRLSKGKAYKVIYYGRPSISEDITLRIECDAGHKCWWTDPLQHFAPIVPGMEFTDKQLGSKFTIVNQRRGRSYSGPDWFHAVESETFISVDQDDTVIYALDEIGEFYV